MTEPFENLGTLGFPSVGVIGLLTTVVSGLSWDRVLR